MTHIKSAGNKKKQLFFKHSNRLVKLMRKKTLIKPHPAGCS